MAEENQKQSGNHFLYLDSARGIASLMVFIMHFYCNKFPQSANTAVFCIFFNGNDAVSFFFVLSGFVLSYKYVVLNKTLDLKQYFVSRFFRLWPPFFVAMTAGCVFGFYVGHELTWSKLYDIFIANKFLYWEEAAMLRFHNLYYYPGWSLAIEFVGSFLLPFYLIIAFKNRKLLPWLIFFFLIVAGQNFYASTHFLLGIIISCYYTEINPESFAKRKWYKYRYIILAAAILLFPKRHFETLSPLGSTFKYFEGFMGWDGNTYTAFSAAVFLVAILYSKKAQRFLENKILLFIGKISFSIYLVHPVAISIALNFIEKALPTQNPNIVVPTIFTCVVVITLVFSLILYHLVELPSIKLGKKLIRKMKPSLIISKNSPN